MIALIYIAMLIFDGAVLFGTGFLIAEKGWSAWWMLFAYLICAGSNPKNIVASVRGETE